MDGHGRLLHFRHILCALAQFRQLFCARLRSIFGSKETHHVDQTYT